MVTHAFNPSIRRQRPADFWVQGQPGLHNWSSRIARTTERSYLKNKQKGAKEKEKWMYLINREGILMVRR